MSIANGTPIDILDPEAAERDWTSETRLKHVPHEHGVLFRVEAVSYAAIQHYADPISGEGEWYSTPPRLELFGYPVDHWTPCGATLRYNYRRGQSLWVNLDPDAKQWASRTCREAIEQFARRRRGQIHILKKQLHRAEQDLALTQPAVFAGAPL